VKSGAGRRKVPIAAVLRDYLAEHLARDRRADSDRCFGTPGTRPFDGPKLQARADKAWRETDLDRITPHDCRHTFASLMIAAGVNAKALQTFMGHANISTTLDTYGHLMPGSEDEAAPVYSTPTSRPSGSGPRMPLERLARSPLAHALAHQWRTTPENRLAMRD
jgi:integrase